jgi:urocanate hydratase
MVTQLAVVRALAALCATCDDWRGRIVLVRGLDDSGGAKAVAATVAGAVTLAVEEDAELARAAMRAGSCDFVVTTLDEALRVMKNEVRKGTALCVAVTAAGVEQEMAERGVVPDLIFDFEGAEVEVTLSRAASFAERRTMDAELAAKASGWRRRWFEGASRTFSRELDRVVPHPPPITPVK